MNDINETLRQLIDEARNLALHSVLRQQKIHQIYVLVMKSGKLWREYKPYYNDALQDMWEYCCSHLEEYDPTKKEVITWLNDEIIKALKRYKYREETRPGKRHQIHLNLNADTSEELINSLDNLPPEKLHKPPSDIVPLLDMWEQTVQWVNTDPGQLLSNTYFQNRPEINAKVLILWRLPPDIPWKDIAKEFNLNDADAKNLPKWYNRHCLPLLRKFGYDQGYI
jgi:hypothetical protein